MATITTEEEPTTKAGHQLLADTFRRAELGAVFFVPTFLYPTLVELADDPIKRVLCHSEKAAAYMADGYAQASCSPGVVITQGGPGATNVLAGLADAWESHTPVFCITPVIPDIRYHGNSYQEVYADFGKVTKYDAEVRTLSRLPEFLGKAYRAASTGAPRPVHLYIDGSLEAKSFAFDESYLDDRYFHYPAFRPQAEQSDVEKAIAALQGAERPALVAGRGTIASSAWDELTRFAEIFDIATTTSLGGKGSIDESHPLSMGVQGSYRRAAANDIIDDADLVVYAGSHVGGATTLLKTTPTPGTPIIHIDIDPGQVGSNYPNTLPLVGDVRTVLEQFIKAADGRSGTSHPDWISACRARVDEWRASEQAHVTAASAPIRPERLAVDLVGALPDDAMIVADTGYAAAWSGAFMDLPSGRNFLACEGSLGWAFPAAIGAKCAVPDRPVVAWCGDGGFWPHIGELETAVRNEINTVTVVLNNHALAFDTHLLQAFWSASHDVDMLSEFRELDLSRIATDMGAFGIRVTDPADIGGAVEAALDADAPAVVEVIIDHGAVAPVAFMAGQGSRGGMLKDPDKMK
ncbi:MAG: thiamine pyrophosphate-binding protein [Actinomycetia bacterium]|nr:thiamine pyrophosphate-binding protein [Actinomycetes bacterium]